MILKIIREKKGLFVTFILYGVISQVFLICASTQLILFPEIERLLDIYGTLAEIIAGMYGIILAGYTFFVSHIDALSSADMTLGYIVTSIKRRFKWLISALTFNVFIVLISYIILTYVPMPASDFSRFFYRLFCNELIASIVFSVILILFYSVWIIDPNCIQKEAAQLKKLNCNSPGSANHAIEYILIYHEIEKHCNRLVPKDVLQQVKDNKGACFEFVLELMQVKGRLYGSMIEELYLIYYYYCCVINCESLSASKEMCTLANNTLLELQKIADKEFGK